MTGISKVVGEVDNVRGFVAQTGCSGNCWGENNVIHCRSESLRFIFAYWLQLFWFTDFLSRVFPRSINVCGDWELHRLYAVSRRLPDVCLLPSYVGQLLKSKVLLCLCTSVAEMRSLSHWFLLSWFSGNPFSAQVWSVRIQIARLLLNTEFNQIKMNTVSKEVAVGCQRLCQIAF